MTWLSDFWRDLGYAFRVLSRNPTFAVVTTATLALTLGANTAMFSLVHKTLIAYLPVREPTRLVLLSRSNLARSGVTRFTRRFCGELEAASDIFDGVLCRAIGSERVTVGTDAGGEPAIGELVSGSYFDVLGVKPHVGRLFSSTDDVTPGSHAVVVLGYRYWVNRFGADPSVVGRTVRLTGYPMTVIGVSPPGFDGLDPGQAVDLRVPLAMHAELRRGPGPPGERPLPYNASELLIVGRLRRDISADRAEQILSARLRQHLDEVEPIATSESQLRASERVHLEPAGTGIGVTRRRYETPLRVLMAVTAAVLLIACLNLANLLLARASARMREFGVRLAVGAGSGRLVRQLLTEGLVVSGCGALLGVVIAYPAATLLIRFMTPSEAAAPSLTADVNATVLGFHVTTAMCAAILLGLAPAIASRRSRIVAAFRGATAAPGSVGARRFLLSIQVALSLVVLVTALLFVRTIHVLRSTDVGMRADRLLVLALSPKNAGRGDGEVLPFFRQTRERVAALPGVSSATYGWVRPLNNASWRTDIVTAGCCEPGVFAASRDVVGPGYFATMGIPIVEGRDFVETDDGPAPRVAIVNEAFVREHGRGRSLLGARIGVARPEYTIVGIARDSKYSNIRETVPPVWFVPYEQQANVKYLDLYVRSIGDPQQIAASVRAAIASVDKEVALFEVRTLEAQVENLLLPERMVATLASCFGITAAALAALGVYGILAFIVTTRRREIAVRIALGAGASTIVRQLTADTWKAVLAGMIVGAAMAAVLARGAASLLYGVTPFDYLSFAAGVGVIAVLVVVAALVPARRASRVDPALTLREVEP